LDSTIICASTASAKLEHGGGESSVFIRNRVENGIGLPEMNGISRTLGHLYKIIIGKEKTYSQECVVYA
jgi:hypothetical protein